MVVDLSWYVVYDHEAPDAAVERCWELADGKRLLGGFPDWVHIARHEGDYLNSCQLLSTVTDFVESLVWSIACDIE